MIPVQKITPHTNNSATADLESKSLKHMDVLDTLFKCVCTADVVVIGSAAVQIMVYSVQTGFFQHSGLLFCQETDRAAEMCSVFFHLTDPAGKFFDFFICKFHAAQTDTVSG